MKKIIIVAYHMGRIGSSSLMGLLNLSGLNIGKKESLIGPSSMNPKGFFELKSQQFFLEKVYKNIYPKVINPPSLNYIDAIGKRHYLEYFELLENEFDSGPIAIKSQRFLTIPFFYYLKNKYDIKIIIMNRDIDEQVNSTKRVWKKFGNSFQKDVSMQFIREYLLKWENFSKKVINYYNFPFLNVSFNKLIINTTDTVEEIFNFINIDKPKNNLIINWFDINLVNRNFI